MELLELAQPKEASLRLRNKMETIMTKPKIQELESIEEIDALLAGDVVHIENFGRALYLGTKNNRKTFTFCVRDNDTIREILSERENTYLSNRGFLRLSTPSYITWKDEVCNLLNKRMMRVGL